MALALRQSDHVPQLPAPFVSVAEAAQRMGLSAGHLRRRCSDDFAAKGLAKCFNGVWGIHPSADPRLSNIESWRDRDLRHLAALRAEGVKPAYISIAEARREVVAGFDEFESPVQGERPAIEHYLATLRARGAIGDSSVIRKCTWRTFYNWSRAYRQHGDGGGLRALVPDFGSGDGPDGGLDAIGPAAWEFALRLLTAGNDIRPGAAFKVTLAHRSREGLIDDPDWRMPGLRTFEIECKRRVPKPLMIMANKGPRKFDALCIPKGQRDYEAIAAGECYIGDERHLDILIRIPDDRHTWRPHRGVRLTAWIDERSRYVVGWIIAPFANSDTILGSLKIAIRLHGIPLRLRTDWGKDYVCAMLGKKLKRKQAEAIDVDRIASVVKQLGIELQPATKYMPWVKAIESFFGTMKEHFDKLLVSFIGGNPTERHEDRHAWAKKNPHLLPTLEEVAAMFAAFLDQYHASEHTGHAMMRNTPAEAIVKFRSGPVRTKPDHELDFLFLSYTEPKLVRRDGVRHLKAWYGWGEPKLVELQGQQVVLGIHPDDAGRAFVCDPATRKPLFPVECERHRFRTKRDAERIARNRHALMKEYSAPARAARGFMLERAAQLTPALPGPAPTELAIRRQPRLTVIDPALSDAIQIANKSVSEGELAKARAAGETVELEDMLDPLVDESTSLVADELPASDLINMKDLISEDMP